MICDNERNGLKYAIDITRLLWECPCFYGMRVKKHNLLAIDNIISVINQHD